MYFPSLTLFNSRILNVMSSSCQRPVSKDGKEPFLFLADKSESLTP